jgi:hypothetical protein
MLRSPRSAKRIKYLLPRCVLGVGRLVVDRGDGGLQLVRPEGRTAQGAGDEGDALVDVLPVPRAAVLFGHLPARTRNRCGFALLRVTGGNCLYRPS